MNTIKASKIEVGQLFRKPRQRKWRIASAIYDVPGNVMDDGRPGVLVCLSDCSQVVLGKDEVVEVPGNQDDLDAFGFAKLGKRRRTE